MAVGSRRKCHQKARESAGAVTRPKAFGPDFDPRKKVDLSDFGKVHGTMLAYLPKSTEWDEPWLPVNISRGASAFDWFPAFVWLMILVSTFAIVAFGHYQVHIDLTLPASSIVVGVGLFVCVVGLLVSPSFESA